MDGWIEIKSRQQTYVQVLTDAALVKNSVLRSAASGTPERQEVRQSRGYLPLEPAPFLFLFLDGPR